MKNMGKSIIYFLMLSFFISACGSQEQPKKALTEAEVNEQLIRVNKMMMQNEIKEIDEYIEQKRLKMETSGTGLRYQIIEPGKSEHPKKNYEVEIRYSSSLMDGTALYGSVSDSSEKFVMGRDEAVRGLEEGISLIGVGGKAFLIVPSHLGHGKLGDFDKIPGNAVLIYKVELVSIKNIEQQ